VAAIAYEHPMPSAASASIRTPTCRISTLRSKSSHDNLDFAIRIVEGCDQAVQGLVTIPDGEPITNQLARSKLDQPDVQTAEAISRL